jgi:hypothetical protein
MSHLNVTLHCLMSLREVETRSRTFSSVNSPSLTIFWDFRRTRFKYRKCYATENHDQPTRKSTSNDLVTFVDTALTLPACMVFVRAALAALYGSHDSAKFTTVPM